MDNVIQGLKVEREQLIYALKSVHAADHAQILEKSWNLTLLFSGLSKSIYYNYILPKTTFLPSYQKQKMHFQNIKLWRR